MAEEQIDMSLEPPPVAPKGIFADQPITTPLAHLTTDYLQRVSKDLRTHIVDPAFMAHLATIIQAFIAHELRSRPSA